LFLISSLFIYSIEAKEIILIAYHPGQKPVSEMLKKVLHSSMDFPREMLRFQEKLDPCKKVTVSAAHICIKEDGEMEFPIVYTKTMKETLGVFWNDELENN
jgi:hypothetical protein